MADVENEEKLSEAVGGEQFKKPILIGKIGKFPRKMQKIVEKQPQPAPVETVVENIAPVTTPNPEPPSLVNSNKPSSKVEDSPGLVYKEPEWGGLPESRGKNYCVEVLKNGSIIETIDLMSKSYWIFGRLPSCDIVMQHPTISRYHAILQYRREGTQDESPGFYIYDLNSTHGTFVNKNRVKPRVYGKIHVGHMLNLGCSTRTYILNGPDEDEEIESPFTVTELKQQRQEKLQKIKEEEARVKKREEQRGIDWGLGEDADEETDLSENPYAQTNNEELYLENPKKALRGFFEREGLDFEYDCTEQGYSQFLCKVELPIDDERGRPIFAEVLHKGKKKEAVVQCALEACRVLDRHGLLRQATHESRKRKPKNWEENDYYDSDDDTFLDRTGSIEKKREIRMKGKATQKAETYESLTEQEKKLSESMKKLEREIRDSEGRLGSESERSVEEDSLDTYMKELKENKHQKKSSGKLKAELVNLKKEHENIVRLINIAKPTDLPPLVVDHPDIPSTSTASGSSRSKAFPVFGKPKKLKVQLPEKTIEEESKNQDEEREKDEEEKMEENEQIENRDNQENQVDDESREREESREDEECRERGESDEDEESREGEENRQDEENWENDQNNENEEMEERMEVIEERAQIQRTAINAIKNINRTESFRKLEKLLDQELPPPAAKFQQRLTKILNTLKKLASNGDRMDVDWRQLGAKKRKVLKLISNLNESNNNMNNDIVQQQLNEKLEYRVTAELNRMLDELHKMTEQKFKVIHKVKKIETELTQISDALIATLKTFKDNDSATACTCNSDDSEEQEKKPTKYENVSSDNYEMWVPPTDQTGDGRTSLNDKFGY